MENAPALKYYDGESLKPLGATGHIFRPCCIIAVYSRLLDSGHDSGYQRYYLHMLPQNSCFLDNCIQYIFCHMSLPCCVLQYLTCKELFTLYCIRFANVRTRNCFLITRSIDILYILPRGMPNDYIAFFKMT